MSRKYNRFYEYENFTEIQNFFESFSRVIFNKVDIEWVGNGDKNDYAIKLWEVLMIREDTVIIYIIFEY